MQVGPGGIAPVTHGGYLVTRHHPLADADQCGVDVAVERHRAVGVAQLDPHSVAGGRARVDDDAVGHRVDRGSDRIGEVDAGVQHTPAVTEVGGEYAFGRHDVERLLQSRLALSAI